MTFIIIFLVTLNALIIAKWNSLPVEVYLCCVILALLAYLFIFRTIPVFIKCNSFSTIMLNTWTRSIYNLPGFREYWIKKVSAQRPVAFYYALTKFEQATEGNFYAAKIDKTTTVVLL